MSAKKYICITIIIIISLVSFAYSSCPYLQQSLTKAKLHLKNVANFNKELVYDDNMVISNGEPAALFWTNPYQTEYERQMTNNATIAIYAQQIYKANRPKYLSQADQLAEFNKLTECVPDMYRCNQLRQQCNKKNEPYQAFDGICNNLRDSIKGSSYTPYSRLMDANYNDGIHSVRKDSITNAPLKSPREIGNLIFQKSGYTKQPSVMANVASIMYGQYISHDMGMRVFESERNTQLAIRCCTADYTEPLPSDISAFSCYPIDIPSNDPFYSQYNMTCMQFLRSIQMFPNDCQLGPSQQLNKISSYIDQSILYGKHKRDSNLLRTLKNGQLIMKDGFFLPKKCPVFYTGVCYVMGDERNTQTTWLATIVLLNMRLHNNLANQLASINSHWTDDQLFQEARKIMIAINQKIIYNDWAPLFLGKNYTKIMKIFCAASDMECDEYDDNLDSSSMNDYSQGAGRFFHQLIPDEVVLQNNATHIYKRIPLSDAVIAPENLPNDFIGTINGMLFQNASTNVTYSFELRNKLFKNGNKDGIGIDLSSLDIQQGRDNGLQPYYKYLEFCDPTIGNISEWNDLLPIMSPENIDQLKKMYSSVEDVDVLVGIFLENKIDYMGPVARCVISEQLYRSRYGDRYFYAHKARPNPFSNAQLDSINNFSFSNMICQTTELPQVPENGFQALSETNALVDCDQLKPFDLNPWQEQSNSL